MFADGGEVVHATNRNLVRHVDSSLRGGGQHFRRDRVVGGEDPARLWKPLDPAVQGLLPADALKGAAPYAVERLAGKSVESKRLLEPAFSVIAPEPWLWKRDEREVRMSRDEQFLCGEASGDGRVVADT